MFGEVVSSEYRVFRTSFGISRSGSFLMSSSIFLALSSMDFDGSLDVLMNLGVFTWSSVFWWTKLESIMAILLVLSVHSRRIFGIFFVSISAFNSFF